MITCRVKLFQLDFSGAWWPKTRSGLLAANGLASVAKRKGRMPLDVILARMDGDASITDAQFQA